MARPPLFSIILPTHNRPAMLAEAVDSVLDQTVPDFELIIIDDGSDPVAVTQADRRIRLIRLEASRGPAVARNAGLRVATGRYITFLDDDDLFTRHRLELALQGLDRAPISTCWGRFMNAPPGRGRTLEGRVADSILDAPTPTLGYTALPRELALEFDERWRAIEDVVWWLKMAEVAPVTTVPEIGYLVRHHRGPRGHNDMRSRLHENLSFLRAYREYLADHPRAAAHRLKRIGLMARSLDDRKTARTAFVRSLRARPRVRTAWHLLRTLPPSRRRMKGPESH